MRFVELKTRIEDNVVIHPESGCWLWTLYRCKNGYGMMQVNRKFRRAHRISWSVFNGPVPRGLFVLHRCDVRECVNPRHLFLGTQKDNMQDCLKKGRIYKFKSGSGEENNTSILTEQNVRDIRRLKKETKKSNRKIADLFGVSGSTISHIVNRKQWRTVK